MLTHGGRLNRAVKRYQRPLEQWLDLSTGINPLGWPIPEVPASCWQRLPESDDGLEIAASQCYASPQLLPVAGSQAAIQALPKLRRSSRVTIIRPGYAEHAEAWRRAGHQVRECAATDIDSVVDSTDVLVVINPNNPSAHVHSVPQLLEWHQRLASRGGWLVVDEAFIDPTPEYSLCSRCPLPGLVVLRSIGKFFGLAGIRCGFVAAETSLLQALEEYLGPWTIGGPSRHICRLALLDGHWQRQTRYQLRQRSARLRQLLHTGFSIEPDGTALFQGVQTERAGDYYEYLAGEGILTRLFADQQRLRFGLPGSEPEWQRLEQALAAIRTTTGTAQQQTQL